MSYPAAPGQHPVLACAGAVRTALGEVAGVDPVYMALQDKEQALVELAAVAAQLDELRLRVLGAADDVAAEHGSRDAAAWLAHRVLVDDAAARGDLTCARSLERHPLVRAALSAGEIDRARAVVVMRSVDALPDSLGAVTRDQASEHLLEKAHEFGPRSLRILGRKVLSVVAPEVEEAHEAQALDDEERRANGVTALHTRRRGDGTTDIKIRCADAVADRLMTYLEAFTSPRRTQPDQPGDAAPTGTGPEDRRTYPQRLGQAFGWLMESLDPSRLPLHGGDATTVIITIDHQTLLGDLAAHGHAHVGDQPLTAAHARRLACSASLLPAVLDGESQVLDLGRTRRLFDRHQRKAMAVRDVTCRAEGCTIPAAWCEAHHLRPWSDGGRTDLADGVLLCSHHHHRAHDHHYRLTRHRDTTITFHRRV